MIRIALTFDQEWSPLLVCDWLKGELDNAGIRGTFFATDMPLTDFGDHEIAIHPNPFRDGSDGMLQEIKRLLDIYPEAQGLRMHRLAWESGLNRVWQSSSFPM